MNQRAVQTHHSAALSQDPHPTTHAPFAIRHSPFANAWAGTGAGTGPYARGCLPTSTATVRS
jgi:hypothetical protein